MIANANTTGSTAPGTVYGRLTVTQDVQPGDRTFKITADCSCGTTDFRVSRYSVVRGLTRSCGCIRRERWERMKETVE